MGHCADATGYPEELAAFIAGGRQRQSLHPHSVAAKLARHLQINRASNNGQPKRDINAFSEPDKQILMDSEVRNEKRRRPDETTAKMMPANVKPAFTTGEDFWRGKRTG